MANDNTYASPGGIFFEKATFYNYDRSKELDIRPIIVEFNVYENISKPFLTASIVIEDALALTSAFPIIGQETLELKFKTPDTAFLKPIDLTLRVVSINEYKRKNVRQVAYILNLMPEVMITDMNTRIRKSYVNMTIEEMAIDIMGNYLGDEFVMLDPTDGTKTFTIPNMSPSNAMNFLARKAKSLLYESSPYFFYQNCDGFFFRTSNDMISPVSQSTEFGRSRTVEKYYGMDFHFGEGKSPRDNAGSGSGGAQLQSTKPYEFLKIKDFTLHNLGNNYNGLRLGYLENKIHFFDPVTSFYQERMYNYMQEHTSFKKTSSNQASTFLLDDNPYIKSGDSFTIFEPTNHLQTNEYSIDDAYEILNKKIGSKNIFENLVATVVIPGDSEKRAGETIELCFPEFGATEDVIGKLNKFISGDYLILAIKQTYNADGYFTYMTVAKNSFENTIEDATRISTSVFDENTQPTGG